jgi:DNA-binding protein YbaB
MADFLGLMKQAAELKSKMEAMQAELDSVEVEGVSGGGMVFKPSDKEIVEDLIVAAHADGRRKADAVLQEKMKAVTGGLPLPAGMKLF